MSHDLSGAQFSPCERYRYRLWRRWDYARPRMLFVMLNPSTADANVDDHTIRKCRGFASRLGFGGIEVVNLFAFRATKPRDLFKAADPVGPQNDAYISAVSRSVLDDHADHEGDYKSGAVVCVWGSNAKRHHRVQAVQDLLFLESETAHALRINGDGTPAHPLMLPFSCKLREYKF